MHPTRAGLRLSRSTASTPLRCLSRRVQLQHATAINLRQCRRPYSAVPASELKFGQPLADTHPHIVKKGDLTPGISPLEYSFRRTRLTGQLPDGGIAILAAADTKYRSGAVFYEFHQNSNFFYLTGFNEPEAVAVIKKMPEGQYDFYLFVRPKDAHAELWDGARSGLDAASDVFNADHVGSIDDLPSLLEPLIADASKIYMDLVPARSPFSRFFGGKDVTTSKFASMVPPGKIKPLQPVMNQIRVTKSKYEISNMRKAGKWSGRAFTNAMRRQWTKEKDLAAFLDYEFKIGGCDGAAYVPVVAGGENALAIHYVRNDDVLHDGQLVLVDAGGEYGGYITDITRTWPVNGKFTPAQKDMYEMILDVQRRSIALCREDANMSLNKIHSVTEQGLRDGLQSLGFDVSGNAMSTLFPHHVGHYIGLDVHDCPGFSRGGQLKAGQCVTIEPGVYVPNDERWPKHFRGMGIRIEDSVCVDTDSPIVLTTEAVKEVADIEALRD